jgi:predicted nucleotidyltransferase
MATEPVISRDLLDGALQLADALNRAGIRYALIGGLAAGHWTQARFTRDVDFLLHIPQLQLPALLDDLSARGFAFNPIETIREWTTHHMVVLSFRGVRVDWLKPVLPAYQHVLDRAKDVVWLGHRVRVASAEGLILLKLLAWRTQDQLDIENLVAAHADTLDLDWIRAEWATIADAADPRLARLAELVAGRRKASGEPGV